MDVSSDVVVNFSLFIVVDDDDGDEVECSIFLLNRTIPLHAKKCH